MEISSFARGFGLGFSLIAAIGAQNAYVLTRGILQNHHWPVALVCSSLDALLITMGIVGMGQLVALWPWFIDGLTVFGALFLFGYGTLSLRRLFRRGKMEMGDDRITIRAAVSTALALSLLNPHVYLDTVVLIGSISVQEPPDARLVFGTGAAMASVVWFFCLTICGRAMQAWFRSARAWQVLDLLVTIVMWTIAISLVRKLIGNA